MKKLLLIGVVLLLLVGCGSKDEFGLGKYDGRSYKNESFKLDIKIPEDFSYLTAEEIASVNENSYNLSENKEVAKYRNLILNVSHTDGTKMMAFVDSQLNTTKNAKSEAINYLNFLSENDVDYSYTETTTDINGLEFFVVDIKLPFNKLQRNYISVNNDKLVNIQVNYDQDSQASAKKLFEMYE